MPNKTKQVKKIVVKTGSALFLVGIDEEYVNSPLIDTIPKEKKTDADEEFVFEPTKSDVAKFRDANFVANLVDAIDNEQVVSELTGWGLDFDKLSNPETGELDEKQCAILNDYIDQNADYVSLTIVDILVVVINQCEFDWRRFTSVLNVKNFDLLKLELGMRYHRRSEIGNATAFLKF